MSVKKDVEKLLKEAERQGWRIEDRGRRYLCFSPDRSTIVTVSKTPSAQSALRNILSDLRKGGLVADFQIEIEFRLGGEYTRDLELLESIGAELEERAGHTGPSAAIHGDRYSVTLITGAPTFLEAGKIAAELVVDAVNSALEQRGDELDAGAFETLMERMLVEHADTDELVPA